MDKPFSATAALLAAALLAALLLRLPGLSSDLGHDEVYTWQVFAARPLAELLTSYPVPNNHLLHSALVHLAGRLWGPAEWALRLPALLAGLAAVAAAFSLGRALLASAPAGLLAAWLVALSPAHIAYSQVARGYTLLVLFALLAPLCFWRGLQGRTPWWWAAGGMAAFLGMWTLPSFALYVGALGLWAPALCLCRGRSLLPALAAPAGALLLAAGAYWPVRDQLLPAARRWGVDVGGDAAGLLAVVAQTVELVAGGWAGLLPGLAGLVGLGLACGRHRALALYAGLAWGLPFLAAALTGIAGQPRAHLFLLPSFVLLVALGATTAPWRGRRFAIPALVLCGYALAAAPGLARPAERGLRDIGRFLQDQVRAGDLVVAPFILDQQVSHYASIALYRGLAGGLEQGRFQRLLFVVRPADPRFALGTYLLRLSAVLDPDHYQQDLRLPGEALVRMHQSGGVEIHALDGSGAPLFAAVDAGDWAVVPLEGEGASSLGKGPPGPGDLPSLRLENPAGRRLALRARTAFAAPGEGLLLLVWARSERQNSTGLLFSEVQREGRLHRDPLPMLRAGFPVEMQDGDGRTWYLEAYLLPVRAPERYGVYLLTWEVPELLVAGVSCHFFPY